MEDEFFKKYREIHSKIKKRFLKKPKISEAIFDLDELARNLDHEHAYDYSAIAFLAKARCENTIGNAYNEIESLLKSARNFVKELTSQIDNGYILNQEELLAAIMNSYSHAIKILADKNNYTYAGIICIEVGQIFQKYGKFQETWNSYFKAMEYFANIPNLFLITLELLYSCQYNQGNLVGASSILTDILEFCNDYKQEYGTEIIWIQEFINKTYISLCLLTLIIQPVVKELKQYTTNKEETSIFIYNVKDDLNIKIPYINISDEFEYAFKNFLMAWEEKDSQALTYTSDDLYNFLNVQQSKLLIRLVDMAQFQNL